MAIPTAQASSLAEWTRGVWTRCGRARATTRRPPPARPREFEALLVQQMMKAMRDALPQEGPLSSDAGKSWISMFDREVAQKMAARGIGLAQAIERQLARQIHDPGARRRHGRQGVGAVVVRRAPAGRHRPRDFARRCDRGAARRRPTAGARCRRRANGAPTSPTAFARTPKPPRKSSAFPRTG